MKLAIQLLLLLLSYLLGGIPWGFIFGKLKGIDIREHGSKNIGSTNTGRVLGPKYAIYTYILDLSKGVLISALFTTGILSMDYCLFGIPILYGIAAVLGHTFSPYINFKGGKAVATGGGVLLSYSPLLFILCIIIFLIIVKKTKYVSLGSLIAASFGLVGSFVLFFINQYTSSWETINIFFPLGTLVISLIIVIRHRSNIIRLHEGRESKISLKHKDNDVKGGNNDENLS